MTLGLWGRRTLGRVFSVGVFFSSVRSVFPWGNLYPKSIEFILLIFFQKPVFSAFLFYGSPAKEEQFLSLFGLDLISNVWDSFSLFKVKQVRGSRGWWK